MNLLSILLIIASLRVGALPIVEHSAYLSSDSVRADRVVPQEEESGAPVKQDALSLGPQLSAQSAIVVDAESGAVLFEKNGNARWPMASIVKMMTALVFLEKEPNLEERAEMLDEDDREGDQNYIRPHESAKLRDYLAASLIGSANNATITLTRLSGMTHEEFVARMNKKAQQLGMRDTTFIEPSGLDTQNSSTANDIAKLLWAASKNSIIRQIAGAHRMTISVFPSGIRRNVLTTNHLMGSIVFVEFGKTGYLDESLYNLATGILTQAGHELYIVTLGSQTNEDRVQDAKNLAVWTQRVYKWE